MEPRPDARILSIPTILIAILTCASLHAATIESTPLGGSWNDPATWVGGLVPTATDDVILTGAVTVSGSPECLSLQVHDGASLTGSGGPLPRELTVHNALTNEGNMADGPYGLELMVGGDLHNAGTWSNSTTTLRWGGVRSLSQEADHPFTTDLVFEAGYLPEVHLTTPVRVRGNITTHEGRLVQQPGSTLVLEDGNFQGNLDAHGNELTLVGWSYLSNCTLDDVVLGGNAEASFSVVVTTRLVVTGSLQNGGTGGGGAITIEGDLVNHGVITHDNYSFNVKVHGDVENYGEISSPVFQLEGVGVTHHLTMGPGAIFDTQVFLPEFVESTLIARTPVHFADSLALGDGTMVLEPGSDLEMSGSASLHAGTILANGNVITWQGVGALGSVAIDQGVLAGDVTVTANGSFTGGLTVTGDISSGNWSQAQMTVAGLLHNQGTFSDGISPVRVTALNDVANDGAFDNSEVIMGGDVDQTIGIGTLFSADLILKSDLPAGPYQWYRDGEMIPGAMSATLTLSAAGSADFGSYQCRSGAQVGRSVLVLETLGTSDAPVPLAGARLEQNHPNPFNPATVFHFTLDRSGPVLLEIFDVAGRRVDTLVQGTLEAGRHSLSWQPRELSSGTYFYALKTEEGTRVRKCVLLK